MSITEQPIVQDYGTYGITDDEMRPHHCPSNGTPTQTHYDRFAFANRQTGAFSRLDVFKNIANGISPSVFEWHGWTIRLLEALCRKRWIGVSGCSNCIDGNTRILNPLTGDQPTIKSLCDAEIAPTVMTLDGPRQAGVPFLKGVDDLFEVVLSDGAKFRATADHIVLSASASRWCHVGDLRIGEQLFSYAPTRQGSTSECAPSIRASDGRSSSQTIEGCLERCLIGSCPDDEQLLFARVAAQSSFPSQGDVLERNRGKSHLDGSGSTNKYTHACPRADHHSTLGFVGLRNSEDIFVSRFPGQETDAPYDRLCQPSGRSGSKSNRRWPFSKPTCDCVSRHSSFYASEERCLLKPRTFVSGGSQFGIYPRPVSSHNRTQTFGGFPRCEGCTDSEALSTGLSQGNLSAWGLRVAQSRVVSIRNVGVSEFYDLSVPGPEHYFAEGQVHHNSAKTFNVGTFAALWWLCAPHESSVIFCSTTMKSMRKRGWAVIQRIHQTLGGDFGHFVDSRTLWQYKPGDDLNAICCMAVQEGDVNKVAANIQGIHTRRQLVIIDEAEAVPAAIWKACINLHAYPIDAGGEFVLVALANGRFRLSQFGRFIEPEGGWDSVSIETDEWEGKPQVDGKKVFVIRFDYRRSPNVVEGKNVSKHLPQRHRVEAKLKMLKEIGGENDPDYWCYYLGFPPPEGFSQTVFTSTMLELHKGYERHTFTGNKFSIVCAFDQAFGGGDRPALRFAALGEIATGNMGIELLPPIIIYPDSTSKLPVRYQLKERLVKECAKVMYRGQEYECLPKDVAIDVTGEGGLGDICRKEWSADVICIQFSGACSEDQCSHEDPRPANTVYKNKRAEMYFRARNALQSGQLKGFDQDTVKELCSLEYYEERNGIKVPITIQDKKEYKLKFTTSPDLADSAIMILEVARRKGFTIIATGHSINRDKEFEEQVKVAEAVYDGIDYSAQNDDFEEDEDFVL